MKRFLAALALSCVISGTALAGHIDTCGAPEPAPGETQTPPGETQAPPEGANTQGLTLLILDLIF